MFLIKKKLPKKLRPKQKLVFLLNKACIFVFILLLFPRICLLHGSWGALCPLVPLNTRYCLCPNIGFLWYGCLISTGVVSKEEFTEYNMTRSNAKDFVRRINKIKAEKPTTKGRFSEQTFLSDHEDPLLENLRER